ncbi:hypothetical protein [Litoribaculum gwangyangense]|jgi:uncharacterized membrane protein YfcA|uniref:Uncharacterized protein n=1 Tax=Litoribaculum gwangyangense TaxID=1130722 RepID=A0ABP9BUL0_9FLAO
MKYLILILTIAAIACIALGFFLEIESSERLIGFGVLVLFIVVFPLFSYHRWKDKNLKDYMLTKENLDKMRETQKEKKY